VFQGLLRDDFFVADPDDLGCDGAA
jgi:hypothetical protein